MSGYPLLDVFWSILELAALVIWLYLVVVVLADVFPRDDIGGPAKALWVAVVVVVPLVGVLAYLVVNGRDMASRSIGRAQRRRQQIDDRVRRMTGGSSTADSLATLARLHAEGELSDDDYLRAKRRVQ